jgi:hypothetical protein
MSKNAQPVIGFIGLVSLRWPLGSGTSKPPPNKVSPVCEPAMIATNIAALTAISTQYPVTRMAR